MVEKIVRVLGFHAMPIPCRVRRGAAALALVLASGSAGLAGRAAAQQASPYVPTDDPSLPLFEHLVARGAVADPSPMVRPFRRMDAVRVLREADTATSRSTAATVRALLARWGESGTAGPVRWRASGRAGGQAYTEARRDQYHPAGPDGVQPYVEATLGATFGPVVAQARPAVEPRLQDDPDWPGRPDIEVSTRVVEGYLSAQWRWARLLYGQLDRNWGPVGLPGFPLSDYAYERQGVELQVGAQGLSLSAFAGELSDETDSLGQIVRRYYFAHRIDARPTRGLHLAVWEGIVTAGAGRGFETRYRNPLALGYLSGALGLGDRGNVMLGIDATWRAVGAHSVQAQLALDDFWYQHRDRNRDRWGLTLMATGPVGRALSYRAYYTQVSSLALRTFNPHESFDDAGVGVGRTFTDMDRLAATVTWPVTPRWLVTPEVSVQRQGEGRIDAPYPSTVDGELNRTPALFLGTVERTWRAALGVRGEQGPLAVSADAGLHHVVNAGHQPGVTDDRVVARIQVTLGLGREGVLPLPALGD